MIPCHDTFRLFIERANDLEAKRFLRSSSQWNWGVTLGLPPGASEGRTSSEESSITIFFDLPSDLSPDEVLREMWQVRLPDQDDVDAFLLGFRRFVAQGEVLNLGKIYNLAERHLVDGFTKSAMRKSRQCYTSSLKRNYPSNIFIGGKTFEPPEKYVINLWMQGHVFHDNQEKRQELGLEKLPDPIRSVVLVQFLTFALVITRQIMLVRNLLKRAIRLGLITV